MRVNLYSKETSLTNETGLEKIDCCSLSSLSHYVIIAFSNSFFLSKNFYCLLSHSFSSSSFLSLFRLPFLLLSLYLIPWSSSVSTSNSFTTMYFISFSSFRPSPIEKIKHLCAFRLLFCVTIFYTGYQIAFKVIFLIFLLYFVQCFCI